MKRVHVLVAIVVTTALAVAVGPAGAFTDAEDKMLDPAVAGEWSPPFSEDGLFDERAPETKEEGKKLATAVSIAVSPDGRIIYWNGVEGFEDPPVHNGWGAPTEKSRTRILDLRAYLQGLADEPMWLIPEQERGIGSDLFCSDLRNLADGRVLAVGGTNYTAEYNLLGLPGGGFTEYRGTKETRLYDPSTGTWSFGKDMNHARWYPSLISLPDGKMLVSGGVERVIFNDKVSYVRETETFDPERPEDGWVDNGESGATELPFYARLHLLPNGKVFYDASGQMWGPGPYLIPPAPISNSVDQIEWNKQKVYDPKNKTWTDAGVAPLGARSNTFSVMLPLKAPYDEAEILIAGGTFSPVVPGSYVGTDITEIVTASGDSIERKFGPRLNNGRWHSAGVVLPSGEVIALNGGDREDNILMGITSGVRQAEMFDGERWAPLASSGRDRVYHHNAILLGDGSILVGGHAPLGFTPLILAPDNYTQGAFASTLRDPSFEVFKPPYLFRGERPRLERVQAGIELGETFTIKTADASKITSVVLSRLPSVTHLADVDQRTIELEFTAHGTKVVRASMPDNPAVALSGHYYLFLMSDNGQGPTPSRAAIVQIGERNMKEAPLPYGI
jgi:hypothetical protein